MNGIEDHIVTSIGRTPESRRSPRAYNVSQFPNHPGDPEGGYFLGSGR